MRNGKRISSFLLYSVMSPPPIDSNVQSTTCHIFKIKNAKEGDILAVLSEVDWRRSHMVKYKKQTNPTKTISLSGKISGHEPSDKGGGWEGLVRGKEKRMFLNNCKKK